MSTTDSLSYDEIYADLMANRIKKPKLIPKPTPEEKAKARFDESKKPTEAMLQDVTAAANAVTRRFGEAEWLEQEARKHEATQRAFDAEQHRLATDGAQSKNYLRAYRRQLEEVSEPVRNYYSLCEQTVQSLRAAEAALRASRISFHKGPGDPGLVRVKSMSEQAKTALTAEEIASTIARDLQAYEQGGPDLEIEHLKLACEEFSEETIRKWWAGIKTKRPKPTLQTASPTLSPQTSAGSSVSGSYFRERLLKSRPKAQGQATSPTSAQVTKGAGSKFDAVIAELSAKADANEAKGIEYQQEPEEETAAAPPKRNLPALVPSRQLATWSDAIATMNGQHAVIENVGNKTVIASWEPSPTNLDRRTLVFQGKDTFLLRHSNRSVSIETSNGMGGYKTLRLPLGTWWLSHRDRRQHRGVTFRPGAPEVVSECLNMWQGWGVVAKVGDWSLIREHIKEVIAGGDTEFANYVFRWIAWSVQNPAAQAEVALVLIGHKGAGKGTLVRCLQRIFGAHAFQVTSREEVIGKFNGHLQDCVLFVADEAYWGGDKRCVGRLQGMITEPTLPIERKGFDLILVPNYLHVVMLAEPGWVIPAGRYERRYEALSVSDVRMGDREYFKALHNQISEGGAEAMMWDLQRMELDEWHPREIPQSLLKGSALQEQQAHTLPPLEQWYLSLLQDGRIPGALIAKPTSKKISRPNTAYTKSLREDAIQRFPRLRWDLSDSGIAEFMIDRSWPKAKKYRDAKGNGWAFEPLLETRAAFDKRYGPQNWNEMPEWGHEG